MELSAKSLSVFIDYASTAGNWSGTPMVDGFKQERGNLTDLKKKGLIITFDYEGNKYIEFTTSGKEFAKSHGIEI